ncbi:hypothetical protein QE152_g22541 [Popillia japonica]|uniref:Uncharacterized protein n=1 Tax=Popillia japonica TaxID=7064 RepID=A0AAW1KLW8_POPJA
MKNTIEIIDREKRKNNIIVSGLTIDAEDPTVLKQAVTNMIKQHLKIDIAIKTTKKIGTQTCVVELEKAEDKINIMRNKHLLKNVHPDKIYINEDLTKQEKDKMKIMREKAKEEIEKGNTVKIGYNKIIVNGVEWRWHNKEKKIIQPSIAKN